MSFTVSDRTSVAACRERIRRVSEAVAEAAAVGVDRP
jgi:hypothetical protein